MVKPLTDEEIRAQIVAADLATAEADRTEPRVTSVRFEPSDRRFILDLKNGTTFIFPADLVQGLTGADDQDLANVEITPSKEGLDWPILDVQIGVPALMMGIFGTRTWMAELGKKGGSRSSVAKRAASIENGKKGGRPRKRRQA